jgi:hypothetical protein
VRVRSLACLGWVACAMAIAPASAAAQVEVQPALSLEVGRNLIVGQSFTVTAAGTAPVGYLAWLLVDPDGSGCPFDPNAMPARARSMASAVPVSGAFSISGRDRPRSAGELSVCAYLRRSSDDPAVVAVEVRNVLEPALPLAVAERTVVAALRRHGFAERVVRALESDCDRRGRTKFKCRFEARFRGYELSGRGRVSRRGGELAYRFRVTAQGVRFVLTERNEGEQR